jgi:hypothetical protein
MTRYFGLEIMTTRDNTANFITFSNYQITKLVLSVVEGLERRLLWSAFLTLTLVVLCAPLQAQRTRFFGEKEDPNEPLRWLRVEKSFGVVPEIDFVNGGMGINLCRGKFIRGNHNGMAGNGYYVGYLYDTDHQISVAGFGGWIGFFRNKFGGQLALKGLYYVNAQTQVFGVRPEAGIGFPKAQLNYGYTFFTEKTEMKMPTHSVTLYVYFGIHSARTNLY